MFNLYFSKMMPTTTNNFSERSSNFSIARKAFIKNIDLSHKNENLSNNLKNNNKLDIPKPIENKSNDLRIQRLRLSTIGFGSMRLKDSNDTINYKGKSPDNNYVNNRRSYIRAGGSIAPKKGK